MSEQNLPYTQTQRGKFEMWCVANFYTFDAPAFEAWKAARAQAMEDCAVICEWVPSIDNTNERCAAAIRAAAHIKGAVR